MRRLAVLSACLWLVACSGTSDKSEVLSGVDSTSPQGEDGTGGEANADQVPGAEAGPAGDTGPVGEVYGPDESYYQMTLEVEMGPGVTCAEELRGSCFDGQTCCRYYYDRNITGLETKFAFGSTHIAPAISFAMTDTMYKPSFAIITLNFGIIIGTSDKPPATPVSGEYEFGGFEPETTITIHNKEFSSKVEGAAGTFNITDWAAEEHGLWAGTLAGTIVQETAKEDKLRMNVEGLYHFILPKPAGGQPGG